MSRLLCILGLGGALLTGAALLPPSPLHARQASDPSSTFKLAFYNIQAGRGEPGLAGHACVFQDTINCSDATQPLNAWGHGIIQDELIRVVQNDPEVIAIGLAESWETLCGSGRQVQELLGWAARTATRNGTTMVARYGFAGPERWIQLDTSLNTNPADTAWVVQAPVCLDAACSRSVDVFAAHWWGNGEFSIQTYDRQAQQTVDFLAGVPSENPVVLIGDLNVWEEGGVVCDQPPKPNAMQILRDGGYTDAWRAVHGTAEGYTGMWNRPGCGVPEGYLFKRIDQAWSRVAVPIGMTRFGMVTPGECAPSDHAGIVARFQLPAATDDTAPLVEVTTPADGAVVSGAAIVSISATDEAGVARVGVTIDGVALGEDSSAPYQVTWDTTAVANGPHTIEAWAEDASGNRGLAAAVAVTVQNAPANSPPTAAFTAACSSLSCNFTDRSTDPDGTIAGWLWDFGDGVVSSQQNPAHSYSAAGTYTVSLTVTDNGGATAASAETLTVTTPAAFNFTLTASPASRRVFAGANGTYSVTTQVTSGSPAVIALSVAGLPQGSTASFTPATLAGSGSAKLTVVTTAGTPGGSFPLTITASGGGTTRTTGVSLIVRTR